MVQAAHALNGRTIVVTRPREQAAETVRAIEERGGKPYLFPTIEIIGQNDLSGVKSFLETLEGGKVDYVILMSVNGVNYLLNAAEILGFRDKVKMSLKNTITIAVGPKTAEAMEKNGIKVHIVPERYTSESILQCLMQRQVRGKTIYIPRTSEAPPELAEKLRKMGNRVEEVFVYRSRLPSDQYLTKRFIEDLKDKKIDAIIFSSSLGVRNFFDLIGSILSKRKLKNLIQDKVAIVAIGPTTAKTLAELGVKVDVVPRKHILDEAIKALVHYWNIRRDFS